MVQASYIKRDISAAAKPKLRSRFNGGSILVAVMFAYAVLPAGAQNLLMARAPVWANVQTETSPLAAQLSTLLQYSVIGVVVLLALSGLGRARLGPWLVVFTLPWAAMTIATVYMEGRFSYTSLIFPFVGLAAASLKDPLSTLRTMGGLTAVLATASIAMAVFKPTAALFAISATNAKSIIGDKLLAGPLYHPNSLGETLALGLPFVSLIQSKIMRRASYMLVVFALVWTGSRSGLIAAALGILVAICWAIVRRHKQRSLVSPLVLLCIYASVVVVGPAIVAYGMGDVRSFSGRGQIWEGSMQIWEQSPIIGNGVHIYSELAKIWNNVGFGAFHGHNMYVNVLITSGILGAVGLTVLYLSILTRSWKLGRAALIGPSVWTISFIADGWMEVPSDLFTLGTISWVVWVPLAITLAGSLHEKNEPANTDAKPLPEPGHAGGLPAHLRKS